MQSSEDVHLGQMDTIRQFVRTFEAGGTLRYHTERTPLRQTIADHSWGMLVFILRFCENPTLPLVREVTHHDVAEWEVGDNPGPAKRRWPFLGEGLKIAELEVMTQDFGLTPNNLTEAEKAWLDLSDCVECCLYSHQVYRSRGYPRAAKIAAEAAKYIESSQLPQDLVEDGKTFLVGLTSRVKSDWHKLGGEL